MRFTVRTAGESHGRGLVTVIEGVPAGLGLSAERDIDPELKRRQGGYGRGARMKIEQDRIEVLAGVRLGETIGAPIALVLWNRDWDNWSVAMAAAAPPEGTDPAALRRVHLPRPGHADLVGVLKYDREDARDILERASARETAARVAAGSLARRLLEEFGVEVGSHVVSIGGIVSRTPDPLPVPLNEASDRSLVRVLDAGAEAEIIAAIDAAKQAGDTLGGEVEVVARGLVPGLGSHVHWDRKLDGRLAGSLMSIPAVKGVEIGLGFEAARRPGSRVHDPIVQADASRGGYARAGNNAGGLEGGMTTGEPLVVRIAMKPISTLMSPLGTVDFSTGREAKAQSERSDVTAVPAMGVIAEALVAWVLAEAMTGKFGGDSLEEMRRNWQGYRQALADRLAALDAAPADVEVS